MKNFNEENGTPENIVSGRPEYTCNLLVSVIADVSSDITGTTKSKDDTVQEILEGAFGEFAHCEVLSSITELGVRSSAANGWKPEKFESLNLTAEVWAKIQITLPFDPCRKLSLSQQRYIHRNATELVSDIIDAEYEAQVSDAGVWLADRSGKPTVFLTGMFDVLEGRSSERKLKRLTAKAWGAIPSDLLGPDQTA